MAPSRFGALRRVLSSDSTLHETLLRPLTGRPARLPVACRAVACPVVVVLALSALPMVDGHPDEYYRPNSTAPTGQGTEPAQHPLRRVVVRAQSAAVMAAMSHRPLGSVELACGRTW